MGVYDVAPNTNSNNDANVSNGGLRLFEYRFLSSERKDKIDEIRVHSIRRCLSQFSLLLGEGHMVGSSGSNVSNSNSEAEAEVAVSGSETETGSSSGTDSSTWGSSSSETDEDGASSNNSCEINQGTDDDDDNLDNEKEAKGSSNVDPEDDVEIGLVLHNKDDDDDDDIEQQLSEYTHIIIPCPGHTANGTNINFEKSNAEGECCSINTEETMKESRKPMFNFRKAVTNTNTTTTTTHETDKKKGNSNNTESSSPETTLSAPTISSSATPEEEAAAASPTAASSNTKQTTPIITTTKATTIKNKSQQQRTVPIFCAICLEQYLPSDTISWSSNNQCTHVFHKECIVQWLVSLGRIKWKNSSSNHIFTTTATSATSTSNRQSSSDVHHSSSSLQLQPSVYPPIQIQAGKKWELFLSARQLLEYDLECPCCRQEFINKGAVLDKLLGVKDEEKGEECYA